MGVLGEIQIDIDSFFISISLILGKKYAIIKIKK